MQMVEILNWNKENFTLLLEYLYPSSLCPAPWIGSYLASWSYFQGYRKQELKLEDYTNW